MEMGWEAGARPWFRCRGGCSFICLWAADPEVGSRGSRRRCSPTTAEAVVPRISTAVRHAGPVHDPWIREVPRPDQKLAAGGGVEPPPAGSEPAVRPHTLSGCENWRPLIDLHDLNRGQNPACCCYTKRADRSPRQGPGATCRDGKIIRSRLDLHQQPPPSQSGARLVAPREHDGTTILRTQPGHRRSGPSRFSARSGPGPPGAQGVDEMADGDGENA